jgi:hypothetical protein
MNWLLAGILFGFKEEIETGHAALKELIARKYMEALNAGEVWAVRLGLKNRFGWVSADSSATPPELRADKDGIAINVSFVAPPQKQLPEPVGPPPIDVTPPADVYANQPPDPSLK